MHGSIKHSDTAATKLFILSSLILVLYILADSGGFKNFDIMYKWGLQGDKSLAGLAKARASSDKDWFAILGLLCTISVNIVGDSILVWLTSLRVLELTFPAQAISRLDPMDARPLGSDPSSFCLSCLCWYVCSICMKQGRLTSKAI